MTPRSDPLSVRLATFLRERGAARPAPTAAAVAPVLRALAELTDRDGRVPTHVEIADATRLRAPSTVANHLRILGRYNLVTLPPRGAPRSVVLTDQGRRILRGDHHT